MELGDVNDPMNEELLGMFLQVQSCSEQTTAHMLLTQYRDWLSWVTQRTPWTAHRPEQDTFLHV
jgi:hypothetical protein